MLGTWGASCRPSVGRGLSVSEAGNAQSTGMLKQKLYLECFGLQSCSQAAPAQRMLIPKSWNTREKLPERAAEQQGMAGEDEDGLVSALGFPGTLWLGLSSATL